MGASLFKVMYGTVHWGDKNAKWHEVEELIPHENYGRLETAYDIGLIKLKEKIVFSETVKPVDLPTTDNIDENFAVQASGWGRLSVIIKTFTSS